MAQGIANWSGKNATGLITKDDINQALAASNYVLNLENRQISSLAEFEIFNGTNLQQLEINNNNVTSLNASGLTSLTRLIASDNQLANVQVSGLTNLNMLVLQGNPLPTGVNVSGLTNLTHLFVSGSNLTSLNLTG